MIRHPIVIGAKVVVLLIIGIIWVILHGVLSAEHFRVAVKIGIVAFVVSVFVIWVIFFMMRSNPRSRLARSMVLTAASQENPEEKRREKPKLTALIGATGVAETNLRPSDIGRFGEALIDVVSDRVFIEKNQPIMITGVVGKKVHVGRLEA